MSAEKERLLAIIVKESLSFGEVELAHGGVSNWYVDFRRTAMDPEGSRLVGMVLFQATRDWQIDSVGGIATGAIPVVSSYLSEAYRQGKPVRGFFVREEVKEHGTRRVIEGRFLPGDRVLIIDDVVTTGKSTFKVIEAIRSEGAEIVGIYVIVDRLQGAREAFEKEGYRFYSIFTRDDILGSSPAC